MRENIAHSSPMETLSCGRLQPPYSSACDTAKQPPVSVSSNVYYGYQPLRPQNNDEPPTLVVEASNKSNEAMETTPCEFRCLGRKRCREPQEEFEMWKKRRHNDKLVKQTSSNYPTNKMLLEEALLRETHGCSYYHWVASNI